MNMENKNYEAPGQNREKAAGSGNAEQSMYERGAEALVHAEEAVSDAYDKTSEKVSETYEKAKNYSSHHPGQTILIALGIGVGLGLILSSATHHRSGVSSRIARPVVNALSDIALEFWR